MIDHTRAGKIHVPLSFKIAGALVAVGALVYLAGFANFFAIRYDAMNAQTTHDANVVSDTEHTAPAKPLPAPLDTAEYDHRLLALANYPPPKAIATSTVATRHATSTATSTMLSAVRPWPTQAVYPNPGAILPFYRVVAYYGNFLSKQMGVLGQYPPDEMLARLKKEVAAWEAADPTTPVMPAIDYIAISAQGSPGADGKYRLRMPDKEIDHALDLAAQVHGIVFLDLQVGLSNVQTEVPLLGKYLSLPQVHLAIDPEFSMKTGARPGTIIGTMSAADVNFAAQYLAALVRKDNLPPKILVVHRFTEDMVTGYRAIKPLPEVQIVVDMDGWGFPAKKQNTYRVVVTSEPVQFAGFKLFYKNDLLPPSTRMLTPQDILQLQPRPIYIQYQ